MVQSLPDGTPFVEESLGSLAEEGVYQAFPDVFDRLLRRVQHVGGIEAVVAQLIHHDFISWEIKEGRGDE